MSGGLRCAHCEEPIEDPARAWRVRTADRPYVDRALHAACVSAFCAARDVRTKRPPLVRKLPHAVPHAVWCPRIRNADDMCACGRTAKPSPS